MSTIQILRLHTRYLFRDITGLCKHGSAIFDSPCILEMEGRSKVCENIACFIKRPWENSDVQVEYRVPLRDITGLDEDHDVISDSPCTFPSDSSSDGQSNVGEDDWLVLVEVERDEGDDWFLSRLVADMRVKVFTRRPFLFAIFTQSVFTWVGLSQPQTCTCKSAKFATNIHCRVQKTGVF